MLSLFGEKVHSNITYIVSNVTNFSAGSWMHFLSKPHTKLKQILKFGICYLTLLIFY